RAHRQCEVQVALLLAALVSASILLAPGQSGATVHRGSQRAGRGVERMAQAPPADTESVDTPRSGDANHNGAPTDGKPDASRPGAPGRDREIDPMGTPVVREGVKSGDPGQPGGARRAGSSAP